MAAIPSSHTSSCLAFSAVALLLISIVPAQAQVWTLPGAGSWNIAENWNPVGIPNGAGVAVTFNSGETESNPAQTANRAITLDAAQTVGSILFNNDIDAFTNSLTAGTGGSLTLDATDAGLVVITTTGSGTGNNTISAPIILIDSLLTVVDNLSASSAAGSLNLTATISGVGGFTKSGFGLATFGTGAKTYTGPTVLNGGRMRISNAAQPAASSSFTINDGAQLTLITPGTYQLGAGTLFLNGSGPIEGPFAPFPGAIRPNTNEVVTIANEVELQTDTLIHVQGAATGSLTFASKVSGLGALTFTAVLHDANLGELVLSGANTYSGGTFINGGTVRLSGEDATLGTGGIAVFSAHTSSPGSSARLLIEAGVRNAISDTATLSLTGGNIEGAADDGFLDLQAGVNEHVAALFLAGIEQVPGTYGSSASAATFQLDEFFAGSGIVTVIPEPSTGALLIVGFSAFAQRRRRS